MPRKRRGFAEPLRHTGSLVERLADAHGRGSICRQPLTPLPCSPEPVGHSGLAWFHGTEARPPILPALSALTAVANVYSYI